MIKIIYFTFQIIGIVSLITSPFPGILSEPTREEQYQFKLDAWIQDLILLESRGDASLKYLDSNGKYSYSCLQFQEATFKSESKRYGITGDIMDCEVQKKIAKAMIQDNWKNWRHWYTSVKVRGLGYPPQKPDDSAIL